MKSPIAILIVLAATLGPTLLLALLLRSLRPRWWTRGTRVALVVVGALAVVGLVVWMAAASLGARHVALAGAGVVSVVSVVTVPLCLAIPIAAGVAGLARRRREHEEPDLGRRAFLRAAVGAAPAVSLLSSGAGVAASLPSPRVNAFDVELPALPPALDGLRVMQITDAHIGTFTGLAHLEGAFEAAREHAPDLVVLTGDIADDLTQLDAVLRLVATLAPRLGVWACPGNHEYHRGIKQVMAIHAATDVPLLRGEGVLLEPAPGARLWLAGADDPANRALGPDRRLFRSIDRALEGRPDGAATILLSHRPYGFTQAARRGVDLTLSGHTHGLQVALGGRSIGEAIWPGHYLLGVYEKGASRLYTSAGTGHWFPFRLNCPAEVAMITLRSGGAQPAVS